MKLIVKSCGNGRRQCCELLDQNGVDIMPQLKAQSISFDMSVETGARAHIECLLDEAEIDILPEDLTVIVLGDADEVP
jgi:hypothetical protein